MQYSLRMLSLGGEIRLEKSPFKEESISTPTTTSDTVRVLIHINGEEANLEPQQINVEDLPD